MSKNATILNISLQWPSTENTNDPFALPLVFDFCKNDHRSYDLCVQIFCRYWSAQVSPGSDTQRWSKEQVVS